MAIWKKTLATTSLALLCTTSWAQETDAELQARMQEAEARLAAQAQEMEKAFEEREMLIRRQEQTGEVEVEVRMRAAELRMAEAARQMADLSMAQLPRGEKFERIIRASRGPVLGVTIGAAESDEPVAGVEILGVTPGGAAAEAGLRAGDTITSINGETLTADHGEQATQNLLEFMQGVEEGDELEIEYLRNGKNASVELTPRAIESNVFAFQFDGENFTAPDVEVHVAPGFPGSGNSFVWAMHDDGFGSMEMVKLTEKLGGYFGTDEGLLVVRAPKNEELKLEDGDVILNIDGRTPSSVSHALRILSSYQGGEKLKVEIMRDKRKRTIEIEMPDNRRSWAAPAVAPSAPVAPAAPVAPVKVVITENDQI